jgi:hypothetical protein
VPSVAIPPVRIKTIGVPRPVLFSGNQESPLGGEDLPIPRMGDRFAIDVTTGQLLRDDDARNLIASLIEATTSGAIMPLILPGSDQRRWSTPVVDGTDQAGSILKVRGFGTNTGLLRGEFFSIVHAGRRYVHMITANMTVPADGRISVPIWPMLRFLTVDGEQCEFTEPMIEGRLVGFDQGAVLSGIRIQPLQFSIVERA